MILVMRVGMMSLSMLPDDLLVKILTLVGIQEATRMHFLSKRWRFLWALCPDLHFLGDGS